MTKHERRLILASSSPRRRELLTEAGYRFEVVAPSEHAEDGQRERESPSELVARLARQKAADVAPRIGTGWLIGCDTVAECQGEILGKPRDRRHAREMLELLSGRIHHVYSGLCLWRRPGDQVLTRVDTTKLKMETLLATEIEAYLNTGLWEGKAGAFGYQDRPQWLRIVSGSESNVVGLPLELLERMLMEFNR